MKDKLEKIKSEAIEILNKVSNSKELEELRIKFLGKKGELTEISKGLGKLPPEEKPKFGQYLNEIRNNIEEAFEKTKSKIQNEELEIKLKEEAIDVTIPGKKQELGKKHPMSTVIDDINNIFIGMGYEIAQGPEIEEDYYNFEALNIPANHPAKDEQDTFYLGNDFVLRTQTSPVQVRVMEKGNLPIKIVAPGRVFRSDNVDATHSPVFHQLEGLVVDKNVTMGDLKGALEVFAKELLGKNTKVRFRPHHFRFTEPSAEMDVSCFACGGEGCRICKGEGWIELLGCGIVNPKVLEMSGIDSKIYSGFAFGMGLERIAMQRYGILDMRLLYENDVKFLKQF